MKSIFLIFSFFIFGLSAHAHPGHDHDPKMIHLKFAKGVFHAHVIWTQGPQTPDESILRIEWKNGADHSPAEPPGTFAVKLYMPKMGHGSSPTQIQPALDAKKQPLKGVYMVSSIYFTMADDWEVQVALKKADGTEEVQTFKVHLDGPDGGHHHDHG